MRIAKVPKCFSFLKKTPRSFKSAFKNMCDFRAELPGLAIAVLLLEGSMPGDTSGRYSVVISICFLHFLFVLLTDLYPCGWCLGSQDTLVFVLA